jgi:hypothetical protein
MDLSHMTLDELDELETEIAAERTRRAGESLVVCTSDGVDVHTIPDGGALLEVRFCTDRSASLEWFPTIGAARAALAALARAHGRVVDNYDSVDLTAPGCFESWARIL